MASSSLNLLPPQIKHDVFINFRGKDTRKKFFSHLCVALSKNGIDAFTDKRLKGGEEICDTLMRKISESQASVVIFSPKYANSRWCLEELVKIVQCKTNLGHEVLPIFLDVEPTHVRNQTGAFGDGFHRLTKNQKYTKKVDIWRSALVEIANLSGWESSKISEAEILEKIVNKIQTILGKMISGDIDDGFVRKRCLKDVELLLFSNEVNSLGIWGCSGIGKTTLAKKLLEQHSSKFEGHWIIEDIGEMPRHELEHSWRKMISKLIGENFNQAPHVFSSDIRRKLHRKRVLIILDDVRDCEQFKKLVGECGIYGPGSKIIVTSKYKQVLRNDCDKTYHVQKLSDDEAIQLLKSTILKKRQAMPEHMELLKQAISYTQGLPLALIILGHNLYNKDIKYWKSELAKLSDIPDKTITKILRASYDKLENTEKEIFLDIACFFHQWKRTRDEDILDACKFYAVIGIERILDKALINVNEWNEIQMHNLLQQMGRHIVTHDCAKDPEDPSTKSRLWRWNDVYDILAKDTGTKKIEILSMELPEARDLTLRPTAFEGMIKLRVLSFRCSSSVESRIHLPEGLKFLPNSIRCLIWDQYPLPYLPQEFHPEFLVELHLGGSKVKELWPTGVMPRLENLKRIDLSYCEELIRIPEFFGCPKLEVLYLSGCFSLEQIPSSIQYLEFLVELHLSGSKVKELWPTGVKTCLGNLKRIDLSYCKELIRIPEFFGCPNLEHLNLSYCRSLEQIPSSIQHLHKLTFLDLSYCVNITNLSELPESLDHLNLHDTGIEKLPSSITSLDHLVHLNLSGCTRLNSLPSSLFESKYSSELDDYFRKQHLIGEKCLLNIFSSYDISVRWKSLRYLYLVNSNLETIPASINQLCHLNTLELSNSKSLTFLPELPSGLEILEAQNCTSLKSIHGLPQPGLIACNFAECVNLNIDARKNWMVEFEAAVSLAHSNTHQEDEWATTWIHYLCIPGSEVPKWFKYSTIGSSLTINRRPKRGLHSCRLAFCVVFATKQRVSTDELSSSFKCECQTQTGIGFISDSFMCYHYKNSKTQHVMVWYDPTVNSCYFTKAIFNFSVEDDDIEIIKSGVTALEKTCSRDCNHQEEKERLRSLKRLGKRKRRAEKQVDQVGNFKKGKHREREDKAS